VGRNVSEKDFASIIKVEASTVKKVEASTVTGFNIYDGG
jgi:hypothetical protein